MHITLARSLIISTQTTPTHHSALCKTNDPPAITHPQSILQVLLITMSNLSSPICPGCCRALSDCETNTSTNEPCTRRPSDGHKPQRVDKKPADQLNQRKNSTTSFQAARPRDGSIQNRIEAERAMQRRKMHLGSVRYGTVGEEESTTDITEGEKYGRGGVKDEKGGR